MTGQEAMDILGMIPPTFKDMGLLIIILSLVEISPVKLNPWKWLKAFAELPKKLEKLEHEFNDDRAFRWRSQIVTRSDRIQDGKKMRRETWKDTMETINNYERYCEKHPDFRNELASMTIEYLRDKYREACERHDFIDEVEE